MILQAARAPDASLESLQGLLRKFDREYAAAPSAKSREAWQRHSDFMRVRGAPLLAPLLPSCVSAACAKSRFLQSMTLLEGG